MSFSWRNAVRICVTLTLFRLFTRAKKEKHSVAAVCIIVFLSHK